jgi:hypothetical protein
MKRQRKPNPADLRSWEGFAVSYTSATCGDEHLLCEPHELESQAAVELRHGKTARRWRAIVTLIPIKDEE